MMDTNFRYELRDRTRTDHDCLDRLITTLDLAQFHDFKVFLQVHHCCFTAIRSRSADQGRSTTTLCRMIDGLADDLKGVSAHPYAPDLPKLPALDPLSIDYMVAGSRLGSQILRKRWGASTDPRVQRANAYFGQMPEKEHWPETCRALSAVPVESARADAIVEDTKTQFQLFATAFAKIVAVEDALV